MDNEIVRMNNSEKTELGEIEKTLATLDSLVSNGTSGIKNIIEASGNVKIAMQNLENEMEKFRISAQKDAYLYEKSLPMWERQLDKIQERIDNTMNKVMDSLSNDFSEESLKKQNMMMDVLMSVNESFNAMVMKLMTR